MFRVTLSSNSAQLGYVANACPEALLEAITETFARLSGSSKVNCDALFSGVSLVFRGLGKKAVPCGQGECEL
jgi:hypothetical protein